MKRNVLLLTIAVIVVCMCAFVGCIGNGNQGTTPNPGLDEGTIQKVYAAAQELGFEGTLEEFLEMCQGEDGKSAYEIAVEYGFEGTEEEWLESLKGEKGDKGATGKDGRDGVDGEDGRDGRDGKDGKDGLNGKDGEDGQNGKDGINGKDGKDGADGKNGEDGKDGKDGEDGKDGQDGKDGRTPEFRVYEGWLQWKYTDETEWKNLYYIGEGGSGSGNPSTEGTVRVTFVLNGGSMPEGVASYIDVTPKTEVILPTPVLEGYQFVGWYLEGGASAVSSTYFVEENVTLYAKWEQKQTINGTPIYNIEDLAKVKNDLTATYVLMNNIDCGGLALPVIGDSESNAFSGTFEGQGFTISNFLISYNQYTGIFGYNTGTIRNLNISKCNIKIESSSASKIYIGIIAGYNTGKIEQCSVTDGDIYINIGEIEIYVGLICGMNTGTVQDSFVTGNIDVTGGGFVGFLERPVYTGGIVGANSGTVKGCFVKVELSSVIYGYGGKTYVAFIAGNNNKGSIENCVSFGSITEGDYKGDVCATANGTIKSCYREDTILSSSLTSALATALSRSAMNQKLFWTTSLTWDENIWDFSNLDLENGKFPTLRYNAK